MTADGSFIAGNIARSAEIDRTIVQTQRGQDLAKAHDQSYAQHILSQKRTQDTEQMRRDKLRHEREERRRQMERDNKKKDKDKGDDQTGEVLDLIA